MVGGIEISPFVVRRLVEPSASAGWRHAPDKAASGDALANPQTLD